MGEHEEQVLRALIRLEQANDQRRPPNPQVLIGVSRLAAGRRAFAWGEAQEHGPRIAELYTSEADRKRVVRALQILAAGGLAELWGPGANVTRVKLTPAGRAAAGKSDVQQLNV